MKTAAIIQARMSSTRLPGKVLRDIAGKPVLWHVVHRLRQCKHVDQIIIATTTEAIDSPLVSFGQQEHILVTRGPNENVLERYRLAVEQSDADFIIRVTGDSPLIDPSTLDLIIESLKTNRADVCHQRHDPSKQRKDLKVVHEGFTVISRWAFEQQVQNGGHDPAVREHVTAKLQQYVNNPKIAEVDFNPEHFYTDVRLSVDTPADLEFMNKIYQLLGSEPGDADLTEVVRLLKRRPELVNINAHVHQKTVEEKTHRLIIRCDGDSYIGLGHVTRCLSLAQSLRDCYSFGIRFAMKANRQSAEHAGKVILESALFPVDIIPDQSNEMEWLDYQISKTQIDGIIFDIRTDLSVKALKKWRKQGLLTIGIDEPSERRLNCDLNFYPPVPQINQMSWSGYDGILNSGWQWILLGPSFNQISPLSVNQTPQILITMGGADPAGMTLKVIESLSYIHHDHEAHVIIGKAFNDAYQAEALSRKLGLNIHFHQHVKDMATFFSNMDLAVVSFGVTAYELAACGIPSLMLSLTDDHALAAQTLHQQEAAYSLGVHRDITSQQIGQQLNQLIADESRRKAMRDAALSLNITNGANNIAAAIKDALKN